MHLTHTMEQRRRRGYRIVLGSVAVLTCTIGTAFGSVTRDALLLTASERSVAPQTMVTSGAAALAAPGGTSTTALGPWDLYHCDGCPDAAGNVHSHAVKALGPWDLYHCDGCPDAAGNVHAVSGVETAQ